MLHKLKKEYEYDFFGLVIIITYKFIIAATIIMILVTYMLPPFGQLENPENRTYILIVGAAAEVLGLIAWFLFCRVKEGTEEKFMNFIDSAWDKFTK